MRKTDLTLGLALIAGLGACDDHDHDHDGPGSVEVVAYGEAFAEEGIPASQFADGWAVTFSQVNVQIADVEVAGARLAGPFTVDLSVASGGRGHTLGTVETSEGHHGGPGYRVLGLVVAGTATRGAEQKTFQWVFDTPVKYSDCEMAVHVHGGAPGRFEITIHADHLFFDSLVSEEPTLRFDALAAADRDGDGEITASELAQTSVGAYDVGNTGVRELWGFLEAQARLVGHADGEAHCPAE
jgi:hypothetical protein